jgi:maleate isomerase
VPDGVAFHCTRITNYLDTPDELAAMKDEVPAAARLLAHAEVHAMAFACTGGSLLQGLGYDETIIKAMEQATGGRIPATTTSTAVVQAMRHLGIRRLAVVTPYKEWLNDRVVTFLTESGFEVARIAGMGGLDTATALSSVPPQAVYVFARRVADGAEFDGLFISCTSFRTAGAVDALEDDLGVPVVSSNQATLWALFRLAGVRARVPGFGQLLQADAVSR